MIKKHHLHWSSLILLFVVVVLGLWYSASLPGKISAQSSTQGLSGFAWSSNIGWIGFDGWPLSPQINPGGDFSGYAWSSNIGWIDFNPSGPYPTAPNHGVRLSNPTGDGPVIGWARACSVFAGNCSGLLKTDSERGGWDGWIKMSDGATWSNAARRVGNELRGFAWGSDVVGWFAFCRDAAQTTGCVTIDVVSASCVVKDASGNIITQSNVNQAVTWSASPNGMTNYCWGTGCTPDLEPAGDVNTTGQTVNISAGTYSTAGVRIGRVKVTDASSNTGEAQCQLNVVNPSQPVITVIPQGIGSGRVTGGSSINCLHNPGSVPDPSGVCTENNGNITLTGVATSDVPNSTFSSWAGDCATTPPTPTTSPCVLSGSTPKTAVATFSIAGTAAPSICSINPTTGLCLDNRVTSIDQQSGGIPAVSTPPVYIKNNGADPVTLIIHDARSRLPGPPLYLSEVAPGDVHCNFGSNTDPNASTSLCGIGSGTYILAAGAIVPFSVTVDDTIWDVLQSSPYQIKIGADSSNCADTTQCATLEFRYQPPDIDPE